MSSVNKAIVIGNLGQDPEIHRTDKGVIATLSVATSEKYTDKSGQKVESTEWHRVVFFNNLAEIVEKYLKKGAKLYVEGKMKTRSWQDKEGNTRYTTEIIGHNMTMLGGNGMTEAHNAPDTTTQSNESAQQAAPLANGAPDDDFPF